MTDLMQLIFEYLLNNHYESFLPREYFSRYICLAEERESALLETLSPSQRQLLSQYESIQDKIHELEAMFQAAWTTSRELS